MTTIDIWVPMGPLLIQVSGLASAASVAAKKGGSGKGGSEEKETKGKRKPGSDEREKAAKIVDMALKPAKVKTVERTLEEAAADQAKAKEYSRLKMMEHRMMRSGESARLKLKLAAIEALPAGKLRDAAKVPDWTPFPALRMAAAFSPPRPDFVDDRMRENQKVSIVKKSR